MLSQQWVSAPIELLGLNETVDLEKKRIRVLRIITRMNVGGPAIQISGLMNNLDSNKFEQLLVTGFCGDDEIDYLQEHGIKLPLKKVAGLGQTISPIRDIRVFFAIREIIQGFDPDIVHTHTAKAGVLGRLATLTIKKRLKRVHTFHGHLLHGYFGKVKTSLVTLTEKFLALNSDVLIAVGKQVKFDLLRAGIGTSQKFHVVGPGLKLDKIPIRNEASSRLGLSSNEFTVTWIGRAVEIKAPYRILEIARECKRQRIDVRFLFVGDGPLRSDLEIASQSEQLKIEFLGWQNNIEAVLGASDLVLLTSLNEGTPVALIQAQMAGIPVLATSVGSTSEVLVDGISGYALPYSTELFANHIRDFYLSPKKCQDFGNQGKIHALSKFSLEKLVQAHTELYEKLLNQSNS